MLRYLVLPVAIYAIFYYNIHITIQDAATPIALSFVNQLTGYFQSGQVHPPIEVSELKPFTRHIVAVGDMHGDYPNALRVLQFSGVVDEKGDWTGRLYIVTTVIC
jgi:hypothetical protein